ncbi:hypothetical protein L3C95_11120 [Chitinophaga filiformis]|uniref:hypothetical protein n=1 Tax=Chitinophaga filiformis TaxID=104663 RepID=UPI001F44175F|nr:hypothetical protein [Chitinophaga filiformis]MCF6402652.1 hypothetical protein [Chitinophaga filiformis]MCF6403430.1 hypothetical protein [Chitinophaga filiformis]
MNKSIQQHWNESELPGLDAILFSDGTMIILNIYASIAKTGRRYYASPMCETTLKSVEKYDDDVWRHIQRHPASFVLPDGKKVYFGEGTMGQEGFVALTENNDQLIWALFCTNSNPFVSGEFVNGRIRVYSTYDLYFNIDILTPEKITIEAAE